MTLPGSLELDPVEPGTPLSGSWYELRDVDGTLLHRQHLNDPRPEVFHPDGTMRRRDLPEGAELDVLVPEVGAAARLRLVSSELPGRDETIRGASVVAELPLDELTLPEGGRDG